METTVRIYVASLLDYNNGRLHGKWIDLEDCDFDASTVQDEIDEMLEASPCAKEYGVEAEEWDIHDYEGFPRELVEMTRDIEKLCDYAKVREEHGDAWEAYVDLVGLHYANESGFQDAYMGEYESEEAFGIEMASNADLFEGCNETVQRYFDYEAYGHDLCLSDYSFCNGFVFLNC